MGERDKLATYTANMIPMGYFGTVGEIAEAIVYLAPDRSSFKTGMLLSWAAAKASDQCA